MQNSNEHLSSACVERNDDILLETLVEHFQLIVSQFQVCIFFCSRVICHDVGTVGCSLMTIEGIGSLAGDYLYSTLQLLSSQLTTVTRVAHV
jgi:hypothetical protein